MTVFSPQLEAFCLRVERQKGQYAICAARRRELDLVAREILNLAAVVVHWGHMNIAWHSGGIAYLFPAKPNGEERARGLQLDGAWFISGGFPELWLPESFRAFLTSRTRRGENFEAWETVL